LILNDSSLDIGIDSKLLLSLNTEQFIPDILFVVEYIDAHQKHMLHIRKFISLLIMISGMPTLPLFSLTLALAALSVFRTFPITSKL
jgi:hypothetical protein